MNNERTSTKKQKNIRKYQVGVTELKNTITALKYVLVGFNSILDEAEKDP